MLLVAAEADHLHLGVVGGADAGSNGGGARVLLVEPCDELVEEDAGRNPGQQTLEDVHETEGR